LVGAKGRGIEPVVVSLPRLKRLMSPLHPATAAATATVKALARGVSTPVADARLLLIGTPLDCPRINPEKS
jgi:hypothetical protein